MRNILTKLYNDTATTTSAARITIMRTIYESLRTDTEIIVPQSKSESNRSAQENEQAFEFGSGYAAAAYVI